MSKPVVTFAYRQFSILPPLNWWCGAVRIAVPPSPRSSGAVPHPLPKLGVCFLTCLCPFAYLQLFSPFGIYFKYQLCF